MHINFKFLPTYTTKTCRKNYLLFGNLGNIYLVKKVLKEEHINKIKNCDLKKCKLCELDSRRNYQKYMEK